jgi:hypothetical protein
VSAYLCHKSWETRVAAGEAIGHLADSFMHHSVQDLADQCVACGGASTAISHAVTLSFQAFNLQQVLDKGSALLASGGQVRHHAHAPSMLVAT